MSTALLQAVKRTRAYSPLGVAVHVHFGTVKINPAIQHIIAIVTIAERGVFFAESVTNLPPQGDVLIEEIASIKGKQKASRYSDKCVRIH